MKLSTLLGHNYKHVIVPSFRVYHLSDGTNLTNVINLNKKDHDRTRKAAVADAYKEQSMFLGDFHVQFRANMTKNF